MKKVLMLILISLSFNLYGQDNHEVKSEVKELTEFHDVIYQIWHTAWPEKNVEMLKSLLPDVEKGFEKIKSAKLPGILREKKTKWEEGLKKFSESVEAYKKASNENDSKAFLDAAEKLHSDYEALVRVIKPMVKEMDEFHQDLYMIYHYYMPEFNYDKIKSLLENLNKKAEALTKAKLSKRLESKQEMFLSAANELKQSVVELTETVNKGKDKNSINKAVDKMHHKYEQLEKIFN
ncbi:MAG: hypothetical protein N2321_03045 [Melioribacteraceae bacterium]|nr:hypothetical protein [Melioribacteraceae bacterium]